MSNIYDTTNLEQQIIQLREYINKQLVYPERSFEKLELLYIAYGKIKFAEKLKIDPKQLDLENNSH